ncbi:MAG: hypothetical protein WA051_02865 [Minisyncoccia bacterium]
MEPISNYLKRFQKVLITASSTESAFREAAELVLNGDIGFFTLSEKGNVLFVRATPIVKNAILLNEKKILNEFKLRSGLFFSEIK